MNTSNRPNDSVPSIAPLQGVDREGTRGTSLLETTVAIAVLSVVMAAAMSYLVTAYRYTELNKDKIFAYEKAVSIITELQAFLETSNVEAASDLDSFEDGSTVRPTLTIARTGTAIGNQLAPFVSGDHPASGNTRMWDGNWKWYRQIAVTPFPGVNSRDLRIVTVRVYRGRDGTDPEDDPGTKYAEVSSVLRTVADAYPTSQSYDIYLLAVESVPGWWVFMDAIKPFIDTTIADLQARNPGLRFRTHWITKSGYGRDPWYRPFWNFTQDSRAATPWLHFYPAKMPPLQTDVISSAFYYVPESVQAWIRNESGDYNGLDEDYFTLDDVGQKIVNPGFNPFPYTLADHFNHCMRSVDAEAWFRLRRDATNNISHDDNGDGDLNDEFDLRDFDFRTSVGYENDLDPTWHILLDRMRSSPSLYKNAIFINLHGELLPMPPMRNYADPAKDPRPKLTASVSGSEFYSIDSDARNWKGGHPGVRVVTHPEEQRYLRAGTPATSQDVVLRVHAWHDNPHAPGSDDILSDPIELQIYGVNLAQRVDVPGGWSDFATPGSGSPGSDRSSWTFNQFPNQWWWGVNAGAGYMKIEALQGGVNVEPVTAPDGALDAYRWNPVGWSQARVYGLGDMLFSTHYPWLTSTFGPITIPAAPNFPISNTTRREGYVVAGWDTYTGNYVYFGVTPVCRTGYVPPQMDPEGVGYTVLRLYNTPLKAPQVGTQGLQASSTNWANNYRLYGRDYIPTTTEAANNFTQDLTTANSALEKNTARWRITIRRTALGTNVRVRNARTGEWVNITDSDPEHTLDTNDSDHHPITVTTRIGSRVQDYNNDGVVDPSNPEDTEEYYLSSGWGNWSAYMNQVMEVLDRAHYSGAMQPDRNQDVVVGKTAYTYIGGLRVRVPEALEFPFWSWNRQTLVQSLPSTQRPENMSTAYIWWSDNALDVPASERFQFQGDPRHVPYRDMKNDAAQDFPNAYNWYFDNFITAGLNGMSRWPGFDSGRIRNTGGDTAEGWQNRYEIDVPRLFQVLRESLAESNMLWTTLTGFSYYYLGIGNEIGYDSANGYGNSIPVNRMPWGQASTSTGYEQSIIDGGPAGDNGAGVKMVRSISTNRWLHDSGGTARSYWWAANWIGEQYPDDMYGYWAEFGNLPAGNAATDFFRTMRNNLTRNQSNSTGQIVSMPYGTNFQDRASQRRTAAEGCTSFFNIGTSSPHSTFHHTSESSVENASLTAVAGGGNELAAQYSFPLPTRAKVSRPFDINRDSTGGIPFEFAFSEYSATRFQAFRTMRYYNHDNGQIGSALIVNKRPASASSGAFIVVNGIDRAAESGSAFISRYSMVSLIHSFLVAGFENAGLGVTANNRIQQLPRVEIISPTIISELEDPATIDLYWTQEWRRWDGQPYTTQYASNFAETNESGLLYVPMWSADNGATWYSMVDNTTLVVPSERPEDLSVMVADTAGPDTLSWNVGDVAKFPQSSYLIRVDCYRGATNLHFSFHQEKIYISRPSN